MQRLHEPRTGAKAGDHGIKLLHVDGRPIVHGLLTGHARRRSSATLPRTERESSRAGRLLVEGLLRVLRTVLQLAIDRAGLLAQSAGVAAVVPVSLLDQIEQARALGFSHQFAKLEVDAFDHLILRRGCGRSSWLPVFGPYFVFGHRTFVSPFAG